jgi:hypothetical protein
MTIRPSTRTSSVAGVSDAPTPETLGLKLTCKQPDPGSDGSRSFTPVSYEPGDRDPGLD